MKLSIMTLNTIMMMVYAECHLGCVVTSPIMLSVIMLNVVMLSAMAPNKRMARKIAKSNTLAYFASTSTSKTGSKL
jgi:hypothetical protein